MLRFDKREEVFFDAAQSFSSESFVDTRNLGGDSFGYGIWLDELKSVKERREKFLIKMGFVEVSSSKDVAFNGPEKMGAERVVECGGAVTSSCTSSVENNIVSDCRDSNGEANCMVEVSGYEWSENPSIWTEQVSVESPCSLDELQGSQMEAHVKDRQDVDIKRKKMTGWLNGFIHKMKKSRSIDASKVEAGKVTRVKVQQKKKRFMEFTAVYAGQEINGHEGLISTMKFSPDGQYIASGGEDGIVRIWRVSLTEAAAYSTSCNSGSGTTKSNSSFRKKMSMNASVVIPEKVFQVSESPLHEFHGHTSDILDLAWSTSNHLLSASKDNTVRLWQVGSNKCLSVFLHKDYVTCIQFNPVDENYFISGSIDGKIRIWEVPQKRVVDWANTRDVVSAVCYQPNGKGFVAGFISGVCRFYELHGTEPLMHAEMHVSGKKKSSGNRITGILFLNYDSERVMITSEDSKIRILDGIDIVHKYQGPTKSGSQTSASFTSGGKHIVSVGENSCIYVWNYDNLHIQSSKAKKSARSCEYFFSEDVSVAIPRSAIGTEKVGASNGSSSTCLLGDCHKDSSDPGSRDQDRFSLANWFSMDISSKGSVTWPEEKLPVWEVACSEQSNQISRSPDNLPHQHLRKNSSQNCGHFSATWGMVIVTAGWDGKIRTFHNFGLPIKS